MMPDTPSIQGLLFDLDGTFADTAPDLTYALNVMRAARNLPPVGVEFTRPVTSTGARGMLAVGFSLTPEHPDYPGMRQEFLEIYARHLCRESALFPGIAELLAHAQSRGIVWGIVTNKAERLARPLIEQLRVHAQCSCIIGGDSTPRMKPHPDPLLAAARALGIPSTACIYVGDDRRDVDAGRAAGMKTIAVRYGYLNGGVPETWGADAVVDCPQDIIPLLDGAEPFGAIPRPIACR